MVGGLIVEKICQKLSDCFHLVPPPKHITVILKQPTSILLDLKKYVLQRVIDFFDGLRFPLLTQGVRVCPQCYILVLELIA